MSEVLALAVEALVLLRHKAVNGYLVKFPGLRCEPVLHVLLDVVVRGNRLSLRAFLGDQNWHNHKETGPDCMDSHRVERLMHASASF